MPTFAPIQSDRDPFTSYFENGPFYVSNGLPGFFTTSNGITYTYPFYYDGNWNFGYGYKLTGNAGYAAELLKVGVPGSVITLVGQALTTTTNTDAIAEKLNNALNAAVPGTDWRPAATTAEDDFYTTNNKQLAANLAAAVTPVTLASLPLGVQLSLEDLAYNAGPAVIIKADKTTALIGPALTRDLSNANIGAATWEVAFNTAKAPSTPELRYLADAVRMLGLTVTLNNATNYVTGISGTLSSQTTVESFLLTTTSQYAQDNSYITTAYGQSFIKATTAYTISQNYYVAYGTAASLDTGNLSLSGLTFQLFDSQVYGGTISNFVAGDTLDLAGIGLATGATLRANNVLTVTGGGVGTITLHLDPTQNYTGDQFTSAADSNGGTDITITPTSTPTVKILATFTGMSGTTPGSSPEGGLIEDSAGNLFGTTAGGGAYSDGTAFEIPKTATGYGALKTLVSFNTSSANSGPPAGLVVDSGNLFGTTYGGGANNAGSVFEIVKGATAPTILASFNAGSAGTTTGSGPKAPLIMDSAGNLFGTTSGGGANRNGAVFEVTKAGQLILLGSFSYYTNGSAPSAGLTFDSTGNFLFGTTSQGGAGYGTVFELPKTGGTPTTLVNFNGTDGSGPVSDLITDSAGDLFGTTYGGGPSGKGAGTVFEIKKTGTTYASTPITLVDFNTSAAGYELAAGLIMDAAGNLFGTTSMGGTNGAGTVFEIKTANTATGYASTPLVVSAAFNFSGYGGQLLADRTTGNLFVPSGGGVGNGTEVEIINSGFVTATPTATAAAVATSPVTTTVAAGGTLNVTGAESIPNLLDNGTVAIASGGSLDVSSAVDPSSSGIFQLTSNASLEIAAALGTGLKIQFLGSAPTSELTIDSAANFGTKVRTASYAGPLLENFTAGDIIDLKGISSAGLGLAYSAASGDLQITGSGNNALATLAFQNSTLGAGAFHTASDGVGGTLITHS